MAKSKKNTDGNVAVANKGRAKGSTNAPKPGMPLFKAAVKGDQLVIDKAVILKSVNITAGGKEYALANGETVATLEGYVTPAALRKQIAEFVG